MSLLNDNMKLNPFAKKKVIPKIKTAKIVFINEFDIIPVNNCLMKSIKKYFGNDYLGSEEYSDVIIDELMRQGYEIMDETSDVSDFVSGPFRVLGEVEFV